MYFKRTLTFVHELPGTLRLLQWNDLRQCNDPCHPRTSVPSTNLFAILEPPCHPRTSVTEVNCYWGLQLPTHLNPKPWTLIRGTGGDYNNQLTYVCGTRTRIPGTVAIHTHTICTGITNIARSLGLLVAPMLLGVLSSAPPGSRSVLPGWMWVIVLEIFLNIFIMWIYDFNSIILCSVARFCWDGCE